MGAGAFGVFVGQFEKAITQGEIDGIAGEAATSFRLFVKVGLCHWTHSQRGGRGAAAGGQVSLPAIVKFYPLYVGYATQFLSLAGTRFGRGEAYIEAVVICWSCDMASRPRDLADRMVGRRKQDDGYLRETFTLPRDKARTKARDFLVRYPKQAYMSGVESWRELPDGNIEFTMRRLPSAD